MILRRFNVEREATDPAIIRELKAEGYEEVETPKKAKKRAKETPVKARERSEDNGTD